MKTSNLLNLTIGLATTALFIYGVVYVAGKAWEKSTN
jgi:hypothetical protein